MPAKWTGRLIGEAHNAGLTLKEIAGAAGLHQCYVSEVLNSEKPHKAAKAKLFEALEKLKEGKQ